MDFQHTTNIKLNSLLRRHLRVYFSFLKTGDTPAAFCGTTFSSIKTSLIRLLTICAPTGAYDLDHRTTPEVVRISKASNMMKIRGILAWKRREARVGVGGGGGGSARAARRPSGSLSATYKHFLYNSTTPPASPPPHSQPQPQPLPQPLPLTSYLAPLLLHHLLRKCIGAPSHRPPPSRRLFTIPSRSMYRPCQ